MVTGTTGAEDQPDAITEARDSAAEAMGQVADSARLTLTDQANSQRVRAASGVSQVAGAIHRVSGELRQEQPAIASIAETAADQAERIGSYLRQTDVADIVSAVERFARRQPIVFYGGAFALGVAAARIIKAAGGTPQDATSPASTPAGSPSALQATGPGAGQRQLQVSSVGSAVD